MGSKKKSENSKVSLTRAAEQWRLRNPAAESSLRKKSFSTTSNIEVPDLNYPRQELEEHFVDKVGFPGEYPFTRGIHSTMYRGRLWTMRQYAGFGTAEEANERYRYLLSKGSTGLSVAFDLPTQMGRDADHSLAKGEVGRVGVSISSVDDMERLFDSISLEDISTSMTINSTAFILLAMYLVVAERRGVDWKVLRGTVQNDVLKEYVARGTYMLPPEHAVKVVTDMFEFCADKVPKWNTISVSGYHIREAGSTAVQELAFTFSNAIAYLDAAIARGMDIDVFAPRIAFFFNCHDNFLEEVAKFRAARRIWSSLIRDKYNAKNPRSMMLRFHTQTAGSTLTAQQPLTNTVRTTLQALAAVMGGTQSLHTNAYDEALCLPSEQSATLALRTQQIIAYESGVADSVDPFGGSYVVEHLTDEVQRAVEELMEEVSGVGGMVAAIERRLPQQAIENAAYDYQQGLERGEFNKVGVNICQDEADSPDQISAMGIDPSLEDKQCKQLAAYRKNRDSGIASSSLEALKKLLEAGQNSMPGVVDAIRCGNTLGEISDVFRAVFGEYHSS